MTEGEINSHFKLLVFRLLFIGILSPENHCLEENKSTSDDIRDQSDQGATVIVGVYLAFLVRIYLQVCFTYF